MLILVVSIYVIIMNYKSENLDLVPFGDDEGRYTIYFRASILKALIDIRHGKSYSSEQVRKN